MQKNEDVLSFRFKDLTGYKFQEVLGKGSFGKVFKVLRKQDNKIFAMKMIQKELIKKKRLNKYVQNEIKVMKELDNKHILKIYDTLQDKDFLYLVLEYCNGGNLQQYIRQKKPDKDQCIFIFSQVLKGFQSIHEKNFLHRDLKPDNIFINDNVFKIADFGLSKDQQFGQSFCGTSLFMAPEILKSQTHDYKADLWSLGVMLFYMLYQAYPFTSRNKLLQEIEKKCNPFRLGENLKTKQLWESSDFDLADLFSKIFVIFPRHRIGFQQLMDFKIIEKHFNKYERAKTKEVYQRIDTLNRKEQIKESEEDENEGLPDESEIESDNKRTELEYFLKQLRRQNKNYIRQIDSLLNNNELIETKNDQETIKKDYYSRDQNLLKKLEKQVTLTNKECDMEQNLQNVEEIGQGTDRVSQTISQRIVINISKSSENENSVKETVVSKKVGIQSTKNDQFTLSVDNRRQSNQTIFTREDSIFSDQNPVHSLINFEKSSNFKPRLCQIDGCNNFRPSQPIIPFVQNDYDQGPVYEQLENLIVSYQSISNYTSISKSNCLSKSKTILTAFEQDIFEQEIQNVDQNKEFTTQIPIFMNQFGKIDFIIETLEQIQKLQLQECTKILMEFVCSKLISFIAKQCLYSLVKYKNIYNISNFENFSNSQCSKVITSKIEKIYNQWICRLELSYLSIDIEDEIKCDIVKTIITANVPENDYEKELKEPLQIVFKLFRKQLRKIAEKSDLDEQGKYLQIEVRILLITYVDQIFKNEILKEIFPKYFILYDEQFKFWTFSVFLEELDEDDVLQTLIKIEEYMK